MNDTMIVGQANTCNFSMFRSVIWAQQDSYLGISATLCGQLQQQLWHAYNVVYLHKRTLIFKSKSLYVAI